MTAAAQDLITLERRGRVGVVTMQSAPVNSISEPWIAAWLTVLDRIEAEPSIGVVHLRSNLKVFAAGGDLKEMRERMEAPDPSARMRDRLTRIQALFNRIEQLRAVVVCEINGDTLGGGMELALACDMRMAAREARLGLPEVKLGLFPAAGGTQRLARLCGHGIANRLILTGEAIDADTAFAFGLVQWVVPAAELAQRAAEVCDAMAALPVHGLRAAKVSIAAQAQPHIDGYAVERDQSADLLSQPETRERVRAFLDRSARRKAA